MADQSHSQSNIQSNSQSNIQSISADVQSKLGVRGVSNVLYALGSMGCRWRPAMQTRARARAGFKGSGRDEGVCVDEGGAEGEMVDEDVGLPMSMRTAVVDALVAALTLTTDNTDPRAQSNSQSNAQSNAQSNSQSNAGVAAVSLEDLSHLLHALAHIGFDVNQVTQPTLPSSSVSRYLVDTSTLQPSPRYFETLPSLLCITSSEYFAGYLLNVLQHTLVIDYRKLS